MWIWLINSMNQPVSNYLLVIVTCLADKVLKSEVLVISMK